MCDRPAHGKNAEGIMYDANMKKKQEERRSRSQEVRERTGKRDRELWTSLGFDAEICTQLD